MDLEKTLREALEKSEEFKEAYGVIRMNARGRVWLVGGFVFRTLAKALYGSAEPAPDMDFVVERPRTPLILPAGWVGGLNSYGNPKLLKGDLKVDFIPLENIHAIRRRGLPPSIENYLSGVSLTIQSIAYEVDSGRLIGEAGLRALREKTVAVNDPQALDWYAEPRGIDTEAYLLSKARAIGFVARHD